MSERPSIGQCVRCGAEFTYKLRAQGGGNRKKWCSKKCRARAWKKNNSDKHQAIVLKYESVPENKDKKRERSRIASLKKYGLDKEGFSKQLSRQGNACRGCLCPLDRYSSRIDHNHISGKVRGLLCDHCNWTLGLIKDNPETLRRLMAHLDVDITKFNVYLIGALKNPRIPIIGNLLRAENYDVMDEWYTPGEFADTNWQAYEKLRGRTYSEALRGRAASNIYMFDRSYLDLSDVVVLVAPGGKSAMLELGYASGRGKPTCIFLDSMEPDRYDVMPGLTDTVVQTEDELKQWLKLKKELV